MLLAGCTVCQNARRTLIAEPAEYHWKSDRKQSLALYRSWAEEAWLAALQECPDAQFSVEYGRGFRDGFVDYVYAGGSGEPPPIPPRRFWNAQWRSPPGHAAASDWFAGYRHGAAVGRDGGYRDQATLQSSLWNAEIQDEHGPLVSYPEPLESEPLEEIPQPEEQHSEVPRPVDAPSAPPLRMPSLPSLPPSMIRQTSNVNEEQETTSRVIKQAAPDSCAMPVSTAPVPTQPTMEHQKSIDAGTQWRASTIAFVRCAGPSPQKCDSEDPEGRTSATNDVDRWEPREGCPPNLHLSEPDSEGTTIRLVRFDDGSSSSEREISSSSTKSSLRLRRNVNAQFVY